MLGSLFVISAPSGAGKTSLTRALVEALAAAGNAPEFSVSYTTRQPRSAEVHGVDYYFVSHSTFEAQIAQQDFLEHAKVFDNYYGTSRSQIEKTLATGQDVILEIDWQGAQQVRHLMPECISIFIAPPSRNELEKRLIGRGQDSPEVIQRRMQDAKSEMSHCDEFKYFIINDAFHTALAELQAIFVAERQRYPRQALRHAGLIEELLS